MKKSKRSIVILVTVMAIAGGIAFWAFNNNQETTTDPVVATQKETSTENIDITTAAYLKDDNTYSTFYTALESVGLVAILEGTDPYTVFAPNDKAFESLPEDTLERLLAPESSEQLKGILSYHIVQGSIASTDLVTGKRIPTLNGQELTVETTDGDIYLIDAKGSKSHVITADIKTSNGIVYEIDAVVLPQ